MRARTHTHTQTYRDTDTAAWSSCSKAPNKFLINLNFETNKMAQCTAVAAKATTITSTTTTLSRSLHNLPTTGCSCCVCVCLCVATHCLFNAHRKCTSRGAVGQVKHELLLCNYMCTAHSGSQKLMHCMIIEIFCEHLNSDRGGGTPTVGSCWRCCLHCV